MKRDRNFGKRIGMLTPSANSCLEPVTYAIVASIPEVSIHFSRFKVTRTGLDAAAVEQFELPFILEAARLLADAALDLIVWNGSSGSWLPDGRRIDERLCEAITAETGVSATTMTFAIWDAFQAIGARRYSLVTPFNDEMSRQIVANYASEGYECVRSRNLILPTTLEKDRVLPQEMKDLIRSAADPKAEAIAVVCTNFRGAPVVDELERELGIPIVDSVSATAWKSARARRDRTASRRLGTVAARRIRRTCGAHVRGLHARRRFLTAAAASVAAPAIARYPAGAAEFTYKLGNDVPAEHPLTLYAQRAATRILQDTGGRYLEVRVFPNSVLGGTAAMMLQLRSGALELLDSGDNTLAQVVPVAALSGVPFTFGSYKDAWDAMAGPLGKYIRNAIAKTIEIYTFDTSWDAGFRQMITGTHPISTPDDLKGMKMRIPNAPMPVGMFKALGASPTPVEAAEIYTALQTHLVDGLEVPLATVESQKLYEVQKYVSITNHIWTGHMLHANAQAWQRLPASVRDAAERAFNATALAERTDVSRGDVALEATLRGQGMQFNRANPAPFKARLQAAGLYPQWRDTFGAEGWALLEKAVGRLT